MNPTMSVEFCITGLSITPEEITRVIGITPTKTWLLGESIQKTALRRKHNGWCISTAAEVISLEETTRHILDLLLPKERTINELCSKHDLHRELSCALYLVDEAPEINFSRDVIIGLSRLGATVDIDIILTA